MFTSGTTGRSKGAVTSHERTLGVARAWAECAGLTARDRYLVVNPFFHTFGYKAGILACLVSGAALVPQAVFDAGQAMRLIEAERITVLPGAPTVYVCILDDPARGSFDLSSLRLAVTGAADVPVALVERMRRELGFEVVLTAYGLTEAVVATMCLRARACVRHHRLGQPVRSEDHLEAELAPHPLDQRDRQGPGHRQPQAGPPGEWDRPGCRRTRVGAGGSAVIRSASMRGAWPASNTACGGAAPLTRQAGPPCSRKGL